MSIGDVIDLFAETEFLDEIGEDAVKEYFELFSDDEILIKNPYNE